MKKRKLSKGQKGVLKKMLSKKFLKTAMKAIPLELFKPSDPSPAIMSALREHLRKTK